MSQMFILNGFPTERLLLNALNVNVSKVSFFLIFLNFMRQMFTLRPALNAITNDGLFHKRSSRAFAKSYYLYDALARRFTSCISE